MIDTFVDYYSQKIAAYYREQVESFLLFCFCEMGYEGPQDDIEEMQKFVDEYGVELVKEGIPNHFGTLYSVSSKKLNYYNSRAFCIKVNPEF